MMLAAKKYPPDTREPLCYVDRYERQLAMVAPINHAEEHRVLFLVNPYPMAKVALDGTIIEANLALSEFFGISPTDMVGRSFADLTHNDDVKADLASFNLVVSGQIPHYSMVKRYLTRVAPGIRTAKLTVTPFITDGKVSSILGILADVDPMMNLNNVKVSGGKTIVSVKFLSFARDNWQWFAGIGGGALLLTYRLIRFIEEVSKQTGIKWP